MRVVHFEIQAENPERAIKFYSKLFGWEFTKLPGPHEYWLIKTGPHSQAGINGGLLRRQAHRRPCGQRLRLRYRRFFIIGRPRFVVGTDHGG